VSATIEYVRGRISLYAATAASEIQAAQMYRINFFFSLVCDFVPLLGVLYVWAGMGPEELYGYGRGQLMAYYLLSALIGSWLPSVWDEVGDNLRDGTLTIYLIRPVSYYWYYFFVVLGSNLVFSSMGLVMLAPVVLAVLSGVSGPVVSGAFVPWILFFLMLPLGFALHFTVGFGIQIMSFWMDRVRGVTYMWGILGSVLGGAYFPLDFLPESWVQVLRLLPFYYARCLPLRGVTGEAAVGELVRGLGVLLLWVVVLWGFVQWLWARGLGAYSAPGG